jgi:hypothetical protein
VFPLHPFIPGYHEASLKLSLLAARRIDASLREESGEDENDEDGGNDGPAAQGGTTASSTNAAAAAAAASSPQPIRTNGSGNGASSPSPATGASASASASASGSAFFSGPNSPTARSASASAGSPGPGRGLGKRRRSTTTVAATPAPADARGGASGSSLEAALLVHHEPPIVVDYFEMSAYAQPSLTEGPQQAENLPQRPLANPELQGEAHPNCALAPSSTSVSPRPLSLSASAHAALAKRLGKTELVEDIIDEALLKSAPPAPAAAGQRPAFEGDRRSVGRDKGGGGGDQRV